MLSIRIYIGRKKERKNDFIKKRKTIFQLHAQIEVFRASCNSQLWKQSGKKRNKQTFFPGIQMKEAFFALGYLRHAEKFLCPNEDQHDVGVEKKLNTKKVFSSSNIIARIFFWECYYFARMLVSFFWRINCLIWFCNVLSCECLFSQICSGKYSHERVPTKETKL